MDEIDNLAEEVISIWAKEYEKAITDSIVFGTGFLAVTEDGNIKHVSLKQIQEYIHALETLIKENTNEQLSENSSSSDQSAV